jgi:hypothetical protein
MNTGLKQSMKAVVKILICFFGTSCTHNLIAQTTYAIQDTAYIHAVERGLDYLKKGKCQSCLNAYQRAFAISQKSALSAMRAAVCAYQCQQDTLVLKYVRQAVAVDYEIAEDVWVDRQLAPEFDQVRSSKMRQYVQAIFANKDEQLGINVALKEELAIIYTIDQEPRLTLDSVVHVYGQASKQWQQHWQKTHRTDSLNLVRIEQIIQQYGYPGQSLVGSKQASTAWLVIQHSPLAIQEKYLPVLQKAANAGEIDKSNLALLIDRIRMYKGKKQLYGSQIVSSPTGKRAFHPIEDESNVNKRRAKVGLGPIEEYAKEFGIKYKPLRR